MADYINEEFVMNPRRAHGQRLSGDKNQTERRLCKMVCISFGLLCVLQAILNISLRLTESTNCDLSSDIDRLQNEVNELTTKLKNVEAERDQLRLRLTGPEPGGCVSPQKCPTGWRLIRNQCYFVSTQSKTWEDSRNDCLSKGADLVVINNRQEQMDLYVLHNFNNAFWIGLSYSETSGIFKWVDGSALNTSFWQPGQPDRGGSITVENCVELYEPSPVLANWNDHNCNIERRWICEKDGCYTKAE